MTKFPGFSPEALAFLRSLKRNNRREWFQPRKEKYESLIKFPMLELVGCLNESLSGIAPEYVTPPQKATFRIYRDVRFSSDKSPYKTHIAAMFPRHGATTKMGGAVFYFHFTEKELLFFGGVYQPDRDELMAYRTLIQESHEELEEILQNKKLRKAAGKLQGAQMTRMPKGFPISHPAEGLLRQKQWYLETTTDSKLITSPRLLPKLVEQFKAMLPLMEFLNRPFAQKKKLSKMAFF
jgi:uncharacterized protein (TIGR02453 family)